MMLPPTPPPPPILAQLAAALGTDAAPSLATVAAVVAAEFMALSRDAYERGDESAGDRLLARSLAWSLVSESGDLTAVRR